MLLAPLGTIWFKHYQVVCRSHRLRENDVRVKIGSCVVRVGVPCHPHRDDSKTNPLINFTGLGVVVKPI